MPNVFAKKNRASQKDIQKGRKPFSLVFLAQKTQKRKRRKLSGPADAFNVSFSPPPLLLMTSLGSKRRGLGKNMKGPFFRLLVIHACRKLSNPRQCPVFGESLCSILLEREPACRKQKGFCLNFGDGSRKDPFERGRQCRQ